MTLSQRLESLGAKEASVCRKEALEYEKLLESVDGVDVQEGETSGAPDTWMIFIDGFFGYEPLYIKTTTLINPTAFLQEYIRVFRRPAPKKVIANWDEFVTFLGDVSWRDEND